MRNTPKEWSRIDRIKSLVQRHNPLTRVPLGDDAFVFKNPPGFSVIAQDMMVENVHFRRSYCSAFDLGHKALAANLSDLAAMGARPHFAQVSLALPANITESWLDDFYKGMTSLADRFQTEIVGGDLTSSPDTLVVDVSVVGSCENPFTRRGANPGDLLLASGPLGLSKAGMLALQKEIPGNKLAKARHLRPEPRLDLLQTLHQHRNHIHALMDCSDGLINDGLILCQKTLGLELEIPPGAISEEIQNIARHLEIPTEDFTLWGGEDYELLMAIPADALSLFPNWDTLGRFIPTKGVFVKFADDMREISEFKGWSHF